MDYKELEDAIRAEADAVAMEAREWQAADVATRLRRIADQLATIRRGRQSGIDASMGKRSGWKVEI